MDPQRNPQLRSNAVGVSHVVFFVVAAAAPLATVVSVSPAAFAFGNGPGVPGTFLLVGLLYLVFSVGFTAMNRYIRSAGGFYPYVANGLGRPAGVAAAFIALATYNAIDVAVYGVFGFFVNDIVKTAGGPDVHWFVYSTVLAAVVFFCGIRSIEFSGKVLGLCMTAEIAILLLLGIAILIYGGGPEGISITAFGPAAVFKPGLGVALVFVVASFIGFEATAVFGNEARDPERTIPRATYLAVIIIAVFYAFVTWTISIHYGPSKIIQEATDNTTTLYLTAVKVRLGSAAGMAMNLMLIISVFACALSFHNTINRYFFAIGREGLVWRGLARTHSDHQSPYVAGAVQTAIAWAMAAMFALGGQDPYRIIFIWMGTLSSIGILTLQFMVSLAVIVFFKSDARGIGLWPRLLAPALSAAALGGCLVLMVSNLSLVSGSDSLIVDSFPVLIIAIGAAGIVFATWIRFMKPGVYENLGRAFI
jgi:amino acid transporter